MQGSLKYGFYEIFKPQVCGELYHLDIILPDSTSGIGVYVCECVCVCVRVYMCVYMCVYVCESVDVRLCLYVHHILLFMLYKKLNLLSG